MIDWIQKSKTCLIHVTRKPDGVEIYVAEDESIPAFLLTQDDVWSLVTWLMKRLVRWDKESADG